MSLVAFALAALVSQSAGHAGHSAPAPAAPAAAGPAAAARLSTGSTTIGDLLANPAARAIVNRHIPGLASHPQLQRAVGMTLRAVVPFSGGMVTPAHLDMIDAELAALPAG